MSELEQGAQPDSRKPTSFETLLQFGSGGQNEEHAALLLSDL